MDYNCIFSIFKWGMTLDNTSEWTQQKYLLLSKSYDTPLDFQISQT